MKTQHTLLRKVPHTALAAIMSLSLALKPVYADSIPTAGTVLNGSFALDGFGNGIPGQTLDGGGKAGFFLQSGSMNLSNLTLQDYSTHGGDGSGGGAGMGGVLFINTGATVTLNNVNFTSNLVQGGNSNNAANGGSLNNLFNGGSVATSGKDGYTSFYDPLVDINGANGSKGSNGANAKVDGAFGGPGGNGSSGTAGGSNFVRLDATAILAGVDVAITSAEIAADAANPLTENVAASKIATLVVNIVNLGLALTDVVTADLSLASGQVGFGGTGGAGGNGGNGGFGFGGAPGGKGGNGGAGGQPGIPSIFTGIGGAAGGDAGNGGNGGFGGFGAGGGRGGDGGTGGAGAEWHLGSALGLSSGSKGGETTTPAYYDKVTRYPNQDDQGNPVQKTDPNGPNYNTTPSFYTQRDVNGTYHPSVTTVDQPTPASPGWDILDGKRPDGVGGSGGSGGVGGFGGGAGVTGSGSIAGGGTGGNGYGGAIFVRAGATLHITGNALFDGNGVRGGQGQSTDPASTTALGGSGSAAGTDIFVMTGGTLNLDPGTGNVITFNGNAYNTSIADDSAASIIPSGGSNYIPSGAGADVHIQSGLVQFNGANVYSGQTILEGGTLQAQDGTGIYWDSNINFKGTLTSDAVLMSNGDFTRYTGSGTLPTRVQWTGSGGFAASGGVLNVKLNNNQTMTWGSNSFVPNGNALVFGSKYATDVVNFKNSINLGNANRTILVTANDATLSGAAANTDFAVMNGIISNGSLTIGDSSHTGIVVLTGVNTYTGTTTIQGGGLALAGDGALNSSTAVSLASGTSFDISGINASSQTIASLSADSNTSVVLGAKNLTAGDSNPTTVAAVISGDGGSLTKQGSGTMTLSGANTYTGATTVKNGTLETSGSERLSDSTNLTVQSGATFRLGGTEALGTIAGAGSFDLQGNTLTTNASADTTVSGVISGGGSLVKNGTAKLTLTGADSYTGATTINDGTVALKDGGSLSDGTALSITTATGIFDISGKSGDSETIASIDTAKDSKVFLGAKNLTAGDSNNTTVAGTISDGGIVSGATGGSFTKTGSGTTTFTAGNSYTGATTITDGTVALKGSGALSDLSAVNITSSTGVFDISAITATSETIASIAGVDGSKVFLGSRNLTAGDASNTLMAGVISSDGGIVAGTGGSLTKTGAGKLTLSGANTYTGDTTVSAGTLETSGSERIANDSDLIVASGATFLLGGFETISSISGAGSINLQSNTLVTKNDTGVNTEFSGVISGSDSSVLTKIGAGKLTLSGANTSTGTANFNEGSADLTGSLASKTVNVAASVVLDSKASGLSADAVLSNDGTINLGNADDTVKSYTSTGTINGPGKLTALTYDLKGGSVVNANIGTGILTSSGSVDIHGTSAVSKITITDGTLNLYSSSAASTINVNSGSVLNLKAPELILDTATVTVNGTLNLDYGVPYSKPPGTETFQKLMGMGTIHTMGNALVVADGGSFTGTLDASGATLTTGGGSGGGGGGGGLTLGGGTTTTQSTEIDSGLKINSGAELDSTTIIIANGSMLDLSGGGTIKFTTLTSKDHTPAIINIGANDFIIPAGSTVSGWITFIGTGKVINNGTVSWGKSPGIAVIPAAFVDGPGSTTKLELAGLGGIGGTDFDQMQLATTLAANGTLNVAHFGGFTSAQGNSFQVLSNGAGGALTPGTITGNFTTVTFDNDGFAPPGGPNPSVSPTSAFVLDLDTGKLTSTGLNNPKNTFADLGSTANERGAAASIFAAAFAGVGPNQIRSSTTAGKLALQITDATGNSSADLAKYTPTYYGSLADYAFMGNQVLVRSVQDRVSPMNYIPSQVSEDSLSQVPETMSVFMGYTYANLNTSDAARATRNDYYAGVNLLASEDYVFGIAGSLSQGSISAALGTAKSDGWGSMMFGRYTVAKSFTFFGSFGFNQQSMDMRRQTVNGSVSGSTDVTSYVGFLGVQYKGWRVGGVSIAPRMSFSYSSSRVAGFSESGAIDALNVSGYNNNRFMGEAGLSALWSTELAGHAFNLELAASVQQYFQNTKSQMAVQIASVPSASYGVNFTKMGSTQAVIQLNAGYSITKTITSYLGYEGHFGNQSTQYAKAGIRVNF